MSEDLLRRFVGPLDLTNRSLLQANHAPSLRLNSHIQVQDRRVDLTYRNALKANGG